VSPDVPFYDLAALHATMRGELDAALARVVTRGWFILGEEVEQFEAAFARYTGARHCVTVGNGLDALVLSLRALGIGAGDEVIVPGATFIATWLAVSAVGATPVPVDVDPGDRTMDVGAAASAVTSRTRAIVPVHLYGHPADMCALRALAERHGLALVEDAAQAHGAAQGGVRCGALGTAAAWSFYPGKNLGALGDGGAVTTDDDALAHRLRTLRNYGSRQRYVHEVAGVNSRLDEVQAAVLRAKLPRLDAWNTARGAIAARYAEGLAGSELALPRVRDDATHAWHLYVVECDDRDGLRDRLARRGVECHVHYPRAPHQQGAYREAASGIPPLPVSERLAATALSLPLSPTLTASQVDRVIDAVRAEAGHLAHA